MLSDLSSLTPAHSLPWFPSFDVGDPRIDGEHRALVECANELCSQASASVPTALLRRAGRELIVLAEVHFESEEALFPLIGYDDRQTHVRQHLGILAGLESLMLHPIADTPSLAAATARLLLVEHIIRHDQEFKCWIEATREG